LILKKKEDGPFWPQLTKEKQKFHWLKVDFNKWKDEDDSEDEGTGQNQDLDEVKYQIITFYFTLLNATYQTFILFSYCLT
jgi:hypothetical protein